MKNLRKGEFIIEYVGEVLTKKEFVRRMDHYRSENRVHWYIMQLGANEYIDAGVKANVSRFINHSCDPNATTETWIVGKERRVRVVALKDMDAGTELTFDYQVRRFLVLSVLYHF